MAKRLSSSTSNDQLEQRVVAFAEQLGRLAGTVQAKAAGWFDRETLTQQMSGIRDGAADLIARLAGGQTAERPDDAPAPVTARVPKARSGGKVDAPGKKHRKPAPSDPAIKTAANRVAKMKPARTKAATTKRRGRG